jgi:hypothetical protein
MSLKFKQNMRLVSKISPTLARNLKRLGPAAGEVVLFEDKREIADCYIVIFLGAGLLAPLPPSCQMVVLVEPNPYQLRGMLEEVDLQKWLGKRELVFVNTARLDTIRSIFYSYLKHDYRLVRCNGDCTRFIPKQGLTQSEGVFYTQVMQIWNESMPTILTTFKSKIDHGIRGILNFSKNVTRYHIDYRTCKGKLAGVPAVICSGGPSLDKDLEALKKFPGIVISCDAPFIGLKKEGVDVDFVVSMDRDPKVEKYYHDVEKTNTVLVASPDIYPPIIEKFAPDIVYLPNMRQHILYNLDFSEHFEGGTCVAHLAFAWARWLGCDPIILCGQDFGGPKELIEPDLNVSATLGEDLKPVIMGQITSVDPAGEREFQTYNKMVPPKEKDEHWGGLYNKAWSLLPTRNRFGKPFTTISAFIEMKTMFEDMIAHTSARVYNSSHGLDIVGTHGCELGELDLVKPKSKEYPKDLRIVTRYSVDETIEVLEQANMVCGEMLKLDSMDEFDKAYNSIVTIPIFKDICFVLLSFELILHFMDVHLNRLKGKSIEETLESAKNYLRKAIKVSETVIAGLKAEKEGKWYDIPDLDVETTRSRYVAEPTKGTVKVEGGERCIIQD